MASVSRFRRDHWFSPNRGRRFRHGYDLALGDAGAVPDRNSRRLWCQLSHRAVFIR